METQYGNPLTSVELCIEARQRLDVACKRYRMAFGAERSLAIQVLCWQNHISRASDHACKYISV